MEEIKMGKRYDDDDDDDYDDYHYTCNLKLYINQGAVW